MMPKIHLIIGIIFAVVLGLFFPNISIINLLIIIFSTVLIDGDHYFYYIIKKKDFSLKRCRQWYCKNVKRTFSLPMNERRKIYSGFYILHGIEWIIILLLFGIYVHNFFLWISIGFLLHWLMDTPSEYKLKRTLDKISLVYNVYRWKKLEG